MEKKYNQTKKKYNCPNDYNKKCGERLKECRELRNLTQGQLADMVSFSSSNYISMIERGERKMDLDKAVLFAKALNVTPDYLLCKTDLIEHKRNEFHAWQLQELTDTYSTCDAVLVHLVSMLGYNIKFAIVQLYEANQPRSNVTPDKLRDFSFTSPYCILDTNGTESEAIITNVIVSDDITDISMTFGEFALVANQLYHYIESTMDNLGHFKKDLDMIDGYNLSIANDISESKFSERDKLKMLAQLKNGEEVWLDLGNGIKGQVYLGGKSLPTTE